jgi:hypothetical protein
MYETYPLLSPRIGRGQWRADLRLHLPTRSTDD